MRSLADLRAKHGPFIWPEPEERWAAVARIDATVGRLLPGDVDGFRARFVRAARHDLAGRALTAGEGYPRTVQSFGDLTRAELEFVEAWIDGCNTAMELNRLGWLPQPSPQRVARLLREADDLPPRTRQRLVERYLDGR